MVLCRSQSEAETALSELGTWAVAHGLTLHPEQTRIVDATQRGGFDFLGYHCECGMRWLSQRSTRALRDAIRAKTGRQTGGSLEASIARVNMIVRGWFAYFKHGHGTAFPRLARWLRMRLRSILRWRRKGKGRGRGLDHQRWPNASCVRRGLFTMQTARLHAVRALAVQSR